MNTGLDTQTLLLRNKWVKDGAFTDATGVAEGMTFRERSRQAIIMSEQQQPKEYIITEFQLKQLQGYADLDFICQAIRSRPAPASSTAPSYQELVDFARWTQTFWKNGIEIMRSNGLVIKSDEPMEKLAFTFYTDLCEIDHEARHLFQEGYKDENYKEETAIESQTIKGYPKPYEQRIARQERERVLDAGISLIQKRIDGIFEAYRGEENENHTARPFAAAEGMDEAIKMLESLRGERQ